MPLAIYMCGTGYHRNSGDVVSELWQNTTTAKQIYDGPGSSLTNTGQKKSFNLGFGQLRGGRTEDNVRDALAYIKQQQPNDVVLLGWSRGAIACYRLANEMSRDNATQGIPVRLFGIDPVAGTSTVMGINVNRRLYDNVGLTNNTHSCVEIIARDHVAFHLPGAVSNVSDSMIEQDKTRFQRDDMPGSQSDMVKEKVKEHGTYSAVASIVRHLAEAWLTNWGVSLNNQLQHTGEQLLNLYEQVILDMGFYMREIKPNQMRTVYMGGSLNQTYQIPKFNKRSLFANAHHDDLFEARYHHWRHELIYGANWYQNQRFSNGQRQLEQQALLLRNNSPRCLERLAALTRHPVLVKYTDQVFDQRVQNEWVMV